MSFTLAIIGATGDLCFRKLMPALFQAFRHGGLSPQGRIIALSRTAMDTEGYRHWLLDKFQSLSWEESYNEEEWQGFAQMLTYQTFNATERESYQTLKNGYLANNDTSVPTIFYLSTTPDLFIPICHHLADEGLNAPHIRVVLEKPLGKDLASAQAINQALRKNFSESQVFRIDHYLGKQSVQNLLALRFGNVLFEPLWRRESIANVQITLAESLGVEGRGGYYDQSGALRDMVQNHLLQLLCFVAMEPPATDEADAIRDEKLKVLRSLRPINLDDINQSVIRAQYKSGFIRGQAVSGYTEENGVGAHSPCETYVALRAEIDNWRWAGVPFFLRTGKRLPERTAEIVIQFRPTPHSLFPLSGSFHQNRLVIHLQPEDKIQLHLFAKSSNRFRAEHGKLVPVTLDLDFKEHFGHQSIEAYERLLRRIISGRLDLFVRSDEQEAAWNWVMPILQAWQEDRAPLHHYAAGTWGPPAASALLARHEALWSEEIGQ